jgi:hypothetical protein
MRRRVNRLGLSALLMLVPTGCSLAFVKGPPQGHEQMNEFSCTESRGLPIFEGLWGGVFIAAGASMSGEDAPGYAWTAAGLGATMVISSVVGIVRVDACRAALEELRQRSSDRLPQSGTETLVPRQHRPKATPAIPAAPNSTP